MRSSARGRWRRYASRSAGALLLASGALMGLIYGLNDWPAQLERVVVRCDAPSPVLRPGERVRLLSWNLQYGASRRYHFFYDGGRDVYADWRVVQQTLDDMAKVMREARPDLLLLQEVDRDSARTARIDELERLRQGLSAVEAQVRGRAGDVPDRPLRTPCWASTRYHRSRFVPVPLRRPLGRVDMHLATGSRFRASWALRRALPPLQEPPWRRAFNLKRAVLEVALPVQGRPVPLMLLNTHLSAFSRGDGTPRRQIQVILARLRELDSRSVPWILAGDFNLLPPGDRPDRLRRDADLYDGTARHNPLAPLFFRYRNGVPPDVARRAPRETYTYQPFGATGPDRRIDYVFVSHGIQIHSFRVVRTAATRELSDHLPLLMEWSLR